MSQPNILVLAGSTRAASFNRKLAREAVAALRSAGADATFADLREYALPLYDGDLEDLRGLHDAALALQDLANRADAFVIVSPEYNGSYSAVLKNAIDWISRPRPGERPTALFRGKPAAVLSASPGAYGGARVLKHLRDLLGMIGMQVVPEQLGVANAAAAFDTDGHLTRPEDIAALRAVAQSVVDAVIAKTAAAA